MSFLKKLFEEKLLEDDREPIVVFEIPGLDGKFGLLPPMGAFWLQLVYVVLISSVVQAVVAVVSYKTIVEHRGKPHTYLIGWGVILPILFFGTYRMIDFLDVQNAAVLTAFAQPFTVAGLRTVEAMYGTSPKVIEHSLVNYIAYYSATIHHIWDENSKERVPVKLIEIFQTLCRVSFYFIVTSLVYSFLFHFDFTPFESPVVLDAVHLNFDLLRPAHLANAYLLAILTYLVLLCGFEITNMGENFKGYKTKQTFRNPLFESSSPTDFWSRRWNLMVHNVLKHGVFLPSLQVVSTPVAALITFVASGLLHEFFWSAIFYEHKHKLNENGICETGCYRPAFFKLTAFFAWCGLLCVIEKYVAKMSIFQWISKNLPVLVVSFLVTLLALPFSHWYTGDWVEGGYFTAFGLGIFNIIKLE